MFVHATGVSGFQHHVGLAHEFEKNRPAIRFFDIECHTSFVRIEVKEIETFFRMRNIVLERRNTA